MRRPEGKRPLCRPGCRWEDNIKVDFKEWDGVVDWIDLAQDSERWRAVLKVVMNLRFPHNAGNFLTS